LLKFAEKMRTTSSSIAITVLLLKSQILMTAQTRRKRRLTVVVIDTCIVLVWVQSPFECEEGCARGEEYK
jgi:hypothetical protein